MMMCPFSITMHQWSMVAFSLGFEFLNHSLKVKIEKVIQVFKSVVS